MILLRQIGCMQMFAHMLDSFYRDSSLPRHSHCQNCHAGNVCTQPVCVNLMEFVYKREQSHFFIINQEL